MTEGSFLAHLPQLTAGLAVTLAILGAGGLIAVAGGTLLCSVRIGRGRGRGLARVLITFFRTVPEVVLIFWAYYCLPRLFGGRVSGFWAGTVTLGLIGSAYLAEIFRAGVEGVARGQAEAARALGLRPRHVWRFVVGPQALRLSIPPLVNYFSEFLKNTTLLSAIGVADLSLQAFLIGGQTFQYMGYLSAIAVVYFAMIFPISLLSRRLEHAHAR